jgi:hypothetical protein
MHIHRLSALLVVGLSAHFAGAQIPSDVTQGARPTPETEVPALLRDLDGASTHEAAARRLLQIAPRSLVPLYEALDGGAASPTLKKELLDLLPQIHSRIRGERAVMDARILAEDDRQREEEYFHVGKHDPRWDHLVLEAYKSMSGYGESSIPKFKAALDAGCNDPVVRYYYLTRSLRAGVSASDEALPELVQVAHEVDNPAYGAQRRFYVNLRLAHGALFATESTGVSQVEIERAFNGALSQYRELLKRPQSKVERYESTMQLYETAYRLYPELDHKAAFDKLFPILNESLPDDSYPMTFAACAYTEWGWDARGPGFADTVTDEGWKLFRERLDGAERYAIEAWKRDPADGQSAAQMIAICMGKGYSRSLMETWFRRAMLADPDNERACLNKMNYLLPKWHGSVAESLEFGRQCVATGTAANRIPEILLDVHLSLSRTAADRAAYLAQPEVWRDLQSAYAKLLDDKSRLESDHFRYLTDRASYLKLAFDCQQWKDFLSLAEEFGTDIDMKFFGGKAILDFDKKRAAQKLAAKPN